MFDFREWSASKVSAGILRGMFLVAGYTGMVLFHFEENDVVVINRSWWKGFSLIWRSVPLGVHLYTYLNWILNSQKYMEIFLHSMGFLLTTPCYLAMIYVQFFHGTKVIQLLNEYLRIFRRVRSLTIEKRVGFGGGRELFLILLSMICQVQEIVFLLGLLHWAINLKNIINWATYTFVFISSNIILRINFIWYLSLGILYSELNTYLRFETRFQLKHQRRHQPLYQQFGQIRRLGNVLNTFREQYYVVCSLQDIFNNHLVFSLTQNLLLIIVLSYQMITDLNFCQFWLWFLFVKIMIDGLIVTLAIQEAVNQFGCIREVLLEMFFISNLKYWSKAVEIFATHLNLCKLKVPFLDIFDISNESFLVIVSGMVSYLVFIVQFVMQLQNT